MHQCLGTYLFLERRDSLEDIVVAEDLGYMRVVGGSLGRKKCGERARAEAAYTPRLDEMRPCGGGILDGSRAGKGTVGHRRNMLSEGLRVQTEVHMVVERRLGCAHLHVGVDIVVLALAG